jgi:outer membrane lipoprotein-sorting protein
MISRRRLLIHSGALALASSLMPLTRAFAAQPPRATALNPDQRADVDRVQSYLNGIRTLSSRFQQSSGEGSQATGQLWLARPGRMRFEYDPPSQLKIVADGFQVTMWDPTTKDFGQWPIGWTAASFLVKDPLSLSGDLRVEKLERVNGLIEATLSQTKKPKEGKVIVRFSENPLTLRGWTTIDSRGQQVSVALTNMQTGMQLADSLFSNDSGR